METGVLQFRNAGADLHLQAGNHGVDVGNWPADHPFGGPTTGPADDAAAQAEFLVQDQAVGVDCDSERPQSFPGALQPSGEGGDARHVVGSEQAAFGMGLDL